MTDSPDSVRFVEFAWFMAVLSTGVATGVMAGHALLLGRFFNWVIESDRAEMFRLNYPVFMQAKKPGIFFDNLFTLALIIITAYNALLFLTKQISVLPVVAAGLQWLFVLIFVGSGFAAVERELLTKGNVSREVVRRFRFLNSRITALSAALLLASFTCLLLLRV